MVESLRPSCDGYKITKTLGHGGFCVVKEVERDGIKYAMKIFQPSEAKNAKFIKDTKAEVDLVHSLDFDEVCKYYDFKSE